MTDIKILTKNNEAVFSSDSIYSSLKSENYIADIKRCLSSSSEDDLLCGFLTEGFYFVRQGQPINEYFIEKSLRTAQLIMPFEEVISESIISAYYRNQEEFNIAKEKLIDEVDVRFPELRNAIRIAISGRYFYRGNIIVGRSGLLKTLYEYIDALECCKENSLTVGYVIKALILSKRIRVRSVEIRKENPDIWNCGYQKIDVLRNYIDVLLNEYISYRKQVGFFESFSDTNPYRGDFDGKKPIWMCWWQGEENMPDLIKACIESVKRNVPDNCEVILITLDNVAEYVTFNDAIIEKFNNEKISLTHLADALRVELLFRYGGMWIDATYYVPHKIDENIFEDDLFSTAFEKPLWGMDIMRGRWNSSLLAAHSNNIVMQFLLEGLWIYWENSDEAVDYFFFDYILEAGYNSLAEIKRQVDSIRKSSNAIYDLQLRMNQRFDEMDCIWLDRAADFYKLNRRNEYVERNVVGGPTYFSYILGKDITQRQTVDFVIKCESYSQLIQFIKDYNPKRLFDYSAYLVSGGRVSRGIIDEFIGENACIVLGNNNDIVGEECVYDKVVILTDDIQAMIDENIKSREEGVYLIAPINKAEFDLFIVQK